MRRLIRVAVTPSNNSDSACPTRPEATRPDWRHNGLCHDDPDLWFPDGKTGPRALQAKRAKAVCQTCPVIKQCAQWALATRQEYGIFGGLDEVERRKILRKQRYQAENPERKWVKILRHQLPEYQGLVAQGLSVHEIARALGTNGQTVRNVQRALEQQDLGAAS